MTERDDQLDVREETGGDLTAHHHVRYRGLQADSLPSQLAEQFLAEQNILSCLQLLLPVKVRRLGGGRGELAEAGRDQLFVISLYGNLRESSVILSISKPTMTHLNISYPL